MNETYIAELKDHGPFPVRTCVGVAALPAGTDIEMTIVSGLVRLDMLVVAYSQIAAKRHNGASL